MTPWATTAAAATLIALAGCTPADSAPSAATTPTADDPAAPGNPEDGQPLPDEVAVSLFRDLSFWTAAASEEMLAGWSADVCQVYDADVVDSTQTTLLLLKELTDAGMEAGDVAASLRYATGWKCPEHYGKSSLTD